MDAKERRRKQICLDLSIQRAKEIRELNVKDSPHLRQKKFTQPTQMEWKDFGNLGRGIIIPDRGFTKQLHKLDEELEVCWDWGSSKWEIWRFPKDGRDIPYHVMTVQTEGRNYRELGADVLLKLQQIRSEKFSAKKLIDYLEELDNQERRRKAKEFREKIQAIAVESFINIHCKLIQVPKEYSVGRAVSI